MTLKEMWIKGLNDKDKPRARPVLETTDDDRLVAGKIIEMIPGAIRAAASHGKRVALVGEFSSKDLLRCDEHGDVVCDYKPNKQDLQGAARIIFDYCNEQELSLYVGGEYKMGSRCYVGPYEILIRLEEK